MTFGLIDLVENLTVPSQDDGRQFVRRERIIEISRRLEDAPYARLGNEPLALVWRHRDLRTDAPFVLLSTHVDSVYLRYSCVVGEREIRGTLDNSATNAVALHLMLAGSLDPQVVVAFTGDEEEDCQGADAALSCCSGLGEVPGLPEMVVTLDLTEERFGMSPFTVENYFRRKGTPRTRLRFDSKKSLKAFIAEKLPGMDPAFIPDAEPDESWQYDEHDLNCFSLCLPCRCLGADMHDEVGVVVRRDDATAHARALVELLRNVAADVRR